MKTRATLICIAAIAAVPSTALGAQDAPVPLSGETLYQAQFPAAVTGAQCTTDPATNQTTYTFDVDDGFAIGTYPGTFDEHVTVVIDRNTSFGPQPFPPFDLPGEDDPPIPGSVDQALLFQQFALVSVQATFTIDSPAGQVEGTKTYSALVAALPNSGACADFSIATGAPANGYYKDVRVYDLEYEARITTAAGTFVDEGNAVLTAREGVAQDTSGNFFFRFDDFLETFQSELGTTVELKPGLGCGDLNHVHERAGECQGL